MKVVVYTQITLILVAENNRLLEDESCKYLDLMYHIEGYYNSLVALVRQEYKIFEYELILTNLKIKKKAKMN